MKEMAVRLEKRTGGIVLDRAGMPDMHAYVKYPVALFLCRLIFSKLITAPVVKHPNFVNEQTDLIQTAELDIVVDLV